MNANALFQDLAVILVAMGLVAALFTRLNWPKVIGYILAGTVIGKYTLGGSFVIDQGSIEVLGQIGVVFLMLAMGLEFNVRKLKKVGHVTVPTAVLDMAVMVWAGHFVGTKMFGWGSVPSLFLGAAISDSATTLLAKTIHEMGWGGRRFTRYVFGITITEDILCIGVIAVLTGIVKSGAMHIGELVHGIGALLLFLVGVTVLGLLAVPRALNAVAKLKDDESLLLTMLGFCFLVAFVAVRLDFSLALGAFLVGVMAAEAEAAKRIYHQCQPLRTMFSAIFFVTIGLLIDPVQMIVHWKAILCVSLVVVVGKSVNCTLGSLLTGQDLKNAVQTGLGLAQIGEFAYLVALIGVSMKAVDASLYQIAVGASVLTTILNPLLVKASDPFADWLERRLPPRMMEGLSTYANWFERFRHAPAPSQTVAAIRLNGTLVLLQLVLAAVFFVAAGLLAKLDFSRFTPFVEANKRPLLWAAASLLTVPNAIFLFFRARALGEAVADALVPAKVGSTQWAQAFRRFTGHLSSAAWVVALFVETALLSGSIMPEQPWARAVVGASLLLVGVLGWKRFRLLGAESLETLRGVLNKEMETDPTDSAAELLDIHTEWLRVGSSSPLHGQSLREINLRARVGVSVVGLERAGRTTVNPAADERLEAGDRVLLLGDDEQLASARSIFR